MRIEKEGSVGRASFYPKDGLGNQGSCLGPCGGSTVSTACSLTQLVSALSQSKPEALFTFFPPGLLPGRSEVRAVRGRRQHSLSVRFNRLAAGHPLRSARALCMPTSPASTRGHGWTRRFHLQDFANHQWKGWRGHLVNKCRVLLPHIPGKCHPFAPAGPIHLA